MSSWFLVLRFVLTSVFLISCVEQLHFTHTPHTIPHTSHTTSHTRTHAHILLYRLLYKVVAMHLLLESHCETLSEASEFGTTMPIVAHHLTNYNLSYEFLSCCYCQLLLFLDVVVSCVNTCLCVWVSALFCL